MTTLPRQIPNKGYPVKMLPQFMPQYNLGGILGDGLSGAGTGAAIGSFAGPIGTGAGALIGAGLSIFGGARRRKREKEERKQAKIQQRQDRNNADLADSKATFATYPSQGVAGITTFAQGGEMQDFANMLGLGSDEAFNISGDLYQLTGPSHEGGGIPADANGDGVDDVEVEGGEVIQAKDKRVFSDRLSPNKATVREMRKRLGVPSFRLGGSYADIANKLGEVNMDIADDRLAKGSNEVLDSRIEKELDRLFEDQEASKTGGDIVTGKKRKTVDQDDMPQFIDGGMLLNALGQGGGGGMGLFGQVANLGNFLQNRERINNIETDLNPRYASAPQFNFIDPTIGTRANLANQTAGALRAINTGSQDRAGASAIVRANAIAEQNRLRDVSAQAENQARQRQQVLDQQTRAQNQAIGTETDRLETEARNAKRQARMDNMNAFTQGVIGNIAAQQEREARGAEALLSITGKDAYGTSTRLLQNNPGLYRALGLRDPGQQQMLQTGLTGRAVADPVQLANQRATLANRTMGTARADAANLLPQQPLLDFTDNSFRVAAPDATMFPTRAYGGNMFALGGNLFQRNMMMGRRPFEGILD